MTTEQTPSLPAPLGEGVTPALGVERWGFHAWVSPAVNADQGILEMALRLSIDRNRKRAADAGWWSSPNPGGTTVHMVPHWRVGVLNDNDAAFRELELARQYREDHDQPDPDKPDVFQARMHFRIVRRDGLEAMAAELPEHAADPGLAFLMITEALDPLLRDMDPLTVVGTTVQPTQGEEVQP